MIPQLREIIRYILSYITQGSLIFSEVRKIKNCSRKSIANNAAKRTGEGKRALIRLKYDLCLNRKTSPTNGADELSDDPLQSMLIFLKLFEEFIEQFSEPPEGCIFASYVYESQQFDEAIRDFIADGFKKWQKLYEDRIKQIMKKYSSKIEIDAGELAEMIMCIIEGGFILSKSLQDAKLIARSLRQFRRYLQLIFER